LCGKDAVFHVRLGATAAGANDLVEANVGGLETYQARCRRHFRDS
jgi:thymidine kinase